jgi:hypothetical protein
MRTRTRSIRVLVLALAAGGCRRGVRKTLAALGYEQIRPAT